MIFPFSCTSQASVSPDFRCSAFRTSAGTVIWPLFVNLAIWVVLYIKIKPLSFISEFGQIPLHYNIYFGIDKIGPWYNVFALPLIGLIVIIFNNILGYTFYLKEKLISHFLVGSQFIVQIILAFGAFLIILLNT